MKRLGAYFSLSRTFIRESSQRLWYYLKEKASLKGTNYVECYFRKEETSCTVSCSASFSTELKKSIISMDFLFNISRHHGGSKVGTSISICLIKINKLLVLCNAFVNVHNLVVIFSYSLVVIFHAVQLWFCFINPWIWSFESHSILLNIKHAMGVTSIVHIVSFLGRIFLPSSFLPKSIIHLFFFIKISCCQQFYANL